MVVVVVGLVAVVVVVTSDELLERDVVELEVESDDVKTEVLLLVKFPEGDPLRRVRPTAAPIIMTITTMTAAAIAPFDANF